MILDIANIGQRVVTAEGTGTIVILEEDFVSFEKSALVKLDKDLSIKRYSEHELDLITTEPKKKNVQ